MERHTQGGDASVEARRPEFDGKKADNPHRGRRQGDPCDLRQRRQVFAMRGLPLQVCAGGQRRSVVSEMPPVPPRASPDEKPHGAKGRLRISGSPRNDKRGSRHPFPASQRPFRVWLDSRYPRHDPESSEAVNSLFPQACVIMGSYPRANRTHINPENTGKPNTHTPKNTGKPNTHTNSKTSRRLTSSRSDYSCE